jgi:hypothetical protein
MAETLDYENLVAQFREYLDPETAHKMERLIHTHIGGPMTTLSMQVQITEMVLKRKPEGLGEEITKLKENMSFAAENIRTIVRALAAATRSSDEESDAESTE